MSTAVGASAAEVRSIQIGGETEAAIEEALANAAGELAGPPNEESYIEMMIATDALHLFEVDGKPIGPAFCSFEEGEGGRRINGVSQLATGGQTAEFIRYSIAFDLASEAAAPWTDLACQYHGSTFVLVLRGHFVTKDLGIVQGYDVLLTAVAP
jgi:hypothetical protein